ncbi:ATP-binding cassette domain-containing protein [Hymenobacter taeanensis]|uniref:ATP-binding cassette domain-containing protein n=1 Tax=Hymenobacter taeanensis TaxID=2735321 RepID=A0A6M6BHX1_9BACT|nr:MULTISPECIES: ABC transporter transmembrane domain-containing protein [Hymenobacter]QJX47696.1 ATP-binding cassette domain-containing protein [Hymenobacter taeanensis]UOQ82819.1 ABC transporter transmembrane domain-containing protein [Hymenobacter sp. 5414T-23]
MARSGMNTSGTTLDPDVPKKKLTKENFKQGLRIFRYVLPYRTKFIVGMVLLALSSATVMAFPWIIGKLTDAANGKPYILPNGNAVTINQIALGLFGIILLQGIFSFGRIWFFTQVSEFTVRDIRQALYHKFVTLPIPYFEKNRVGAITSRITSDVGQIQDSFSLTLAELFRQIMTLVVGIVFIMMVSVKLSLFMLLTFPPIVVLAMVFGRKIRVLAKATQDELAKTNVIVEETLQGINTVKAFTNELFETGRYTSSLTRTVQAALRSNLYRGGFVSFVIIGLFGGIILVLWRAASLVASGQMTIGDLTSFALYTIFIGASVGGLGELYGKVQSTLGASERILEILDEPSEPTHQALPAGTAPLQVRGDIDYRHVAFSYPTRPDLPVLQDINFGIQAGEKIALVGPSGAGKSTIVQLLMQFYELSGGKILIDGRDVRQFDLTELRSHIGIVPQETLLFGGSIRENIAYGKIDATDAEITAAARKANAWQFISTFPEGLDTLVGERGVKLSGGQRQRIAIARAILKNPAILILDEATSALDSESEKLVQSAMDELMQDRTSIIIAHRLSTIRKVDKILVIDGGRIVEQGSHDELAHNDNGIYSKLLKLQFELS